MAKVFYLHWNEAEAKTRAASLRKAGHRVHLHWSTETTPALKDDLPDIVVLSIDRLPSHGRAIAEWLWEAKSRQHIPIVFEGGVVEKREAMRARFPKAIFCDPKQTVATVARLLKP